MAKHRADSIMEAFVSALSSAVTRTVVRGREYALDQSVLPATFVRIGREQPNPADSAWPVVVPRLRVWVVEEAAVSADIESTLLSMRRDTTRALRSDPTLGLSYVIDTIESYADEPDYDGDPPSIALLRHEWIVQYRRNWDDPTQ